MGLAWVWVSVNTISLAAVSKENMGQASSVLNLFRVLGGSFGIAVLTTLLSRGAQVHQNRLVAHVTRFDLDVRRRLATLASAFQAAGSDPFTAKKRALAKLYTEIQRQASMLSFLGDFRLVAILLFAIIPLVLIMKRIKVGEDSGGDL
jgi:DHA2 family multidrug resistance protein